MNTLFNSVKSILLLTAFAFIIIGCSHDPIVTQQEENLSFDTKEPTSTKSSQFNFNSLLKGINEVPANNSEATGEAIIKISKDESTIHYKIITANITDIFGAHLHLGPAGANGPVVAFLYNGTPSGAVNGILAEGNITAADLIGPFSGGELNALIAAIRNGNIYVNVHTIDNPPGEIRGQL
jgi:hypothetical protein